MAGLFPEKKSLPEIEKDFDTLKQRHEESVSDWLKNRSLGCDEQPNENYNTTPSLQMAPGRR